MALDVFPHELLWPNSLRWYLNRVSDSGGVSEGGFERFAVTDGGGKWMCEYAAPLLDADTVKLARAMISRTKGGSVPLYLPFYAEAEAPYPLGTPADPVPFGDGSTFSDGSEFASGTIEIKAGAAALRATTLSITIAASGELMGGEVFSIIHTTRGEHIYVVDNINDDGTIDISPPLREAIPADTELNFDTPKCKVILINASDAMAAVTPPYMASLSLQFRETW